MHDLELILMLLAVVAVLAALANRTAVPYPIFLVAGGLAISLIPGLPPVELDPEVVFILFLPPILFSAAYFTSWRDFRANLRPIGLLAVGCVLTTTGAVAVVAHAVVPDLPWSAAFALGAVVAPPDAAAATATFQRLGVPGRIVTILEGESLVNDASALVAYRFAVAAVVTGSFSLWSAGGEFVLATAGGVAVGLAVGWLLARLIPLINDPPIEISATLIAPAAAYVPAEQLGVSGVLAAVTAGLYFGRRSPLILSPASRVRGESVWGFVVFLINGLVFILIGLQLPDVLTELAEHTAGELLGYAAAIVLIIVVARFVWVYPATYLPRMLSPRLRARDPAPPWQYPTIIAWAGLRGVVSLAAALALPLETDAGASFPGRHLIIFLTFCVILATLVGQGLTLPLLVRWLGIGADDQIEREETLARREAARAALTHLDGLIGAAWVPDELAEKLRQDYEHILGHLPDCPDTAERDSDHVAAHVRLRREVVAVQRQVVIELRNRGVIGDEALRRIERDLDLEEIRSQI